jgi:hypothetical protein
MAWLSGQADGFVVVRKPATELNPRPTIPARRVPKSGIFGQAAVPPRRRGRMRGSIRGTTAVQAAS